MDGPGIRSSVHHQSVQQTALIIRLRRRLSTTDLGTFGKRLAWRHSWTPSEGIKDCETGSPGSQTTARNTKTRGLPLGAAIRS
jgi:hypothetical protein